MLVVDKFKDVLKKAKSKIGYIGKIENKPDKDKDGTHIENEMTTDIEKPNLPKPPVKPGPGDGINPPVNPSK